MKMQAYVLPDTPPPVPFVQVFTLPGLAGVIFLLSPWGIGALMLYLLPGVRTLAAVLWQGGVDSLSGPCKKNGTFHWTRRYELVAPYVVFTRELAVMDPGQTISLSPLSACWRGQQCSPDPGYRRADLPATGSLHLL